MGGVVGLAVLAVWGGFSPVNCFLLADVFGVGRPGAGTAVGGVGIVLETGSVGAGGGGSGGAGAGSSIYWSSRGISKAKDISST